MIYKIVLSSDLQEVLIVYLSKYHNAVLANRRSSAHRFFPNLFANLAHIETIQLKMIADPPSTPCLTCGEADLHGSLSVSQHLELGQWHLVGHAHRVGAFVPFIADIPHGVADCIYVIKKMNNPGPILVGFAYVRLGFWGLHLPCGHIITCVFV